jgi:hypothetical protein
MAEAILSPDGKLQLVRHSILYPAMGPKAVQGALKNLSQAPVTAEVEVEFCNESGGPLGRATGVFKDIAPGEVRLFDVWAERLPNMYEIESHKIISVKTVA